MDYAELRNATLENDVPLSIMNISGSAADNVSDTFPAFVPGTWTAEYLAFWADSVRGLLCCDDSASDQDRAWFAERGLNW